MRAAIFGTQATPNLPRCVQARRMLNPRKVKLSPFARSTRRVLSRLSSTSSVASSSRSRLLRGRLKPPPPAVAVDQDHQVIGESSILDVVVASLSGDVLRPLQHLVHLVEIEIAEQG